MQDFHDKLKSLIHASGMDYKQLSLKIGQGERYISNMLNSKSDPGFGTVAKLCAELNVTPNHLLGIEDKLTVVGPQFEKQLVSAQAERLLNAVTREAQARLLSAGVRPSFDDVLLWWHQQKGLLANFDGFETHIDLFKPPKIDSTRPIPHYMGPNSLASTAFGVADAAQLKNLLQTFSEDLCEKIVIDHVKASQGNPVLTIENLDVKLPGCRFPARFVYKRLLLPVHDGNGNEYILNYSQPLD